MAKIRPMKLLLPGIFLLVLGFGNLLVGTLKGRQYERVVHDLSNLEPSPQLAASSPLRRIQVSRQTTDRLYERMRKAQNRCDFYRLVSLGGSGLVGLSLLLVIPGFLLLARSHRLKRSESNNFAPGL